jgi:hypothetical protein
MRANAQRGVRALLAARGGVAINKGREPRQGDDAAKQ